MLVFSFLAGSVSREDILALPLPFSSAFIVVVTFGLDSVCILACGLPPLLLFEVLDGDDDGDRCAIVGGFNVDIVRFTVCGFPQPPFVVFDGDDDEDVDDDDDVYA